jgi:hypothetical protein
VSAVLDHSALPAEQHVGVAPVDPLADVVGQRFAETRDRGVDLLGADGPAESAAAR